MIYVVNISLFMHLRTILDIFIKNCIAIKMINNIPLLDVSVWQSKMDNYSICNLYNLE